MGKGEGEAEEGGVVGLQPACPNARAADPTEAQASSAEQCPRASSRLFHANPCRQHVVPRGPVLLLLE
eukprot:9193652-Pyramimonas_sp.AAC.1